MHEGVRYAAHLMPMDGLLLLGGARSSTSLLATVAKVAIGSKLRVAALPPPPPLLFAPLLQGTCTGSSGRGEDDMIELSKQERMRKH